MKYKKTSALAMLLAVAIVASVTCALATSAAAPTPTPMTEQTEGIKRTAPIIVPESYEDGRMKRIYCQTDLPNVKCFGWMDEANRENSTILSRIYYYLTCEMEGAVAYQELPAEAKQLMADYQKELNAFIATLTSDQIFDEARQSVNKAVLLPLLWAERDRLTEELSVKGIRVRAINFSGEVLTRDSQWDAFYFTSDFYDNLENPKEYPGPESGGGILAGSIAQPGIVMDWGVQTDGKGFITSVSENGWAHFVEQFRDPESGVTFRYIPKDKDDEDIYTRMKNDIEISPDNGLTWWTRQDERLIFYHDDFPDHVIEHIPVDDKGEEPNWAQGWRVREVQAYTVMETTAEKIFNAVRTEKIEGIRMPDLKKVGEYTFRVLEPVVSPIWYDPNLARQYLVAKNEYTQIYQIQIVLNSNKADEQTEVHYVGTKDDGTIKRINLEVKEGEQLPKFNGIMAASVMDGEWSEYWDDKDAIMRGLQANRFEKLMPLKVPNYQQLTVAEFDKMIQETFTKDEIAQMPLAIASGDLPADGEDGFFLIGYIVPSADDITWKAKGKLPDEVPYEFVECDAWKAMKKLGATRTNMNIMMAYEVIDPEAITTLERAEKIRACAGEVQEFVVQMGADVLYGPELGKVLKAESEALSEKFSTDAIRFWLKDYDLYYTYKGTDYIDRGTIEEK